MFVRLKNRIRSAYGDFLKLVLTNFYLNVFLPLKFFFKNMNSNRIRCFTMYAAS
jgi:hypothetical protein